MTKTNKEFEHLVRASAFQRNIGLEQLLTELNERLAPAEDKVVQQYEKTRWPILLVIGAPRSGSTLMTQWLANMGQFAYPTNFLSRFYRAPYLGALIQQMLTEPHLQFRDEFKETSGTRLSFESNLGKTSGIMAPNEFWYFWRRFFTHDEIHYLESAALEQVDTVTMNAELAALEAAFAKPLVMKGMILGQNAEYLDQIFDRIVFVYTRREPFYCVQSLLQARRKFSGTIEEWYSLRPREYSQLKTMDPYLQVAGQVHYLNRRIEEALATLHPERHLTVDYEDFCQQPAHYYELLRERYEAQGCALEAEYRGQAAFDNTDCVTVSEDEAKRIRDAIAYFTPEPMPS